VKFRSLFVIGLTVLAACGGSDDPVAAPTTTTAPAPKPDIDGPVSTLSPDIPESYLDGVGAVDVGGDSLPPLEDEIADAAVGMTAPTLVGLDLDGDPIRVDAAVDGPAMLVFVAHWCPHCNAELPKLNELHDAGALPADLDVVAISTAVAPDRPNWPPDEWLNDTMAWTYPAMLDAIDLERETFVAAEAYGVNSFPFVVLVDGDGKVVTRWAGEREPAEILAQIDLLGL
jgi:cytochrome c biogenesis protein CcmG/thiol:disulfide interchange protein DsbE